MGFRCVCPAETLNHLSKLLIFICFSWLDSGLMSRLYNQFMNKKEEQFTIGKLVKEAGVKIDTIRFYERKGLIEQPSNSTGYRKYPFEDAIKIKFIKRTQELGFTLKEAKDLLDLKMSKTAKCSSVKNQADLKIIEVEQKIKDLQKIKRTLKRLSESCESNDFPTSECPILESFEKGLK